MEDQAGGVQKSSASETDMLVFGQKVHIHGELAHHSTPHPPQHHDPHVLVNYAAAAREEMHEVHEHPPPVNLAGGRTGVDEWDKVNAPKMHHE